MIPPILMAQSVRLSIAVYWTTFMLTPLELLPPNRNLCIAVKNMNPLEIHLIPMLSPGLSFVQHTCAA